MNLSLSDNSLPKEIILRNRNEIDEIFKQGRYISCNIITLLIMASDQEKVAFFVSKKAGNAVRRNKIKRWLREIYRHEKMFFKGLKVIFLVKTPQVFDYQRLKTEILGAKLDG